MLRAQLDATPAAGPAAGAILDMVMDKVRSFGGRVEGLSQTGVVGVFGLEKAEDGPRRAAHAATAMVQAVERTSEQRPERIGIKVALHTDRLLVGWAGTGPEIDLSAKRAALDVAEALVASAAAQPIAVSAASHAHLARRFTMIPEDGAYRLVGRERTGPARTTTFAGRRQELALIRHRLESAARGHGQIVAVVGEPGMGKSRLIYEFRRSLGDGRLTALEGGCVAFPEGVPYLPIMRMLEQACGIRERDPASRIVRKIRRTLRVLGIGPTDDAVYLLALFGVAEGTEPLSGLTDEAMGVHIRETLRQMYEAGARRGPLLLIVEDLQWIDHASERALSLLAERLPALPILLVVTYRPGLRPDWITRSYATQIALEPLAGEESADVIHSILSEAKTPPELIHRLVERGGGNPFYLEELALAVREGGADAGTAIPASVQDVLLARIEQAPPDARALLQSAAVLGREVSVPLLRLLSPDPDRADAGLRELTQREFLCPQAGGEDEIYVFRHALTQEVAYHALPEPERVARHAAAGRTLEALHGEGEVSGRGAQVLAYHFGQAGRWDKALRYLLQAAQRAARAFATREAIALYDGAEAAAGRLSADAPAETRMAIHRGRAELYVLVSEFERAIGEWEAVLRLARGRDRHAEGAALVAIGQSLLLSHRFDQSLARAHEAVALGSALDAPSVVAGGLVNEAMVYEFTGRLAEARQTFDRALVLSRRARDVANEATALVFAAELESWEGHYAVAASLYERGIQIGRDHHVLVPVLEGLFMSGINFTGQGAYDRALAVFEEGLALAERVGDENYTPRYLNSLGWLCMECGDLARARELNARAAEGGRRRGDHESYANAELNLGDIALLTGDLALAADYLEAVRRLVEDAATSEWMRWRYSIHLWASLSGLALARGDLQGARAMADECLERATRTRSRKYLVKGWRLRGEVAARRRRWDEAEQACREALDVAEHIGNPPLLWTTHVAMARLWAKRQRPEAARQAYDAARRVFEETRRSIRAPSLRATFDATAPEAPPLAVEHPD